MDVHRKKLTKLLIGVIVGNSVPLTLAVISFAWFYSNTRAQDQNVDGSVGLREYFYRGDGYIGDGSELCPHEIVTPLHFYNLTRLQNLGVFPEKTYFRVGHKFTGYESEGYKCLDGDTKVDVLDMSTYCNNNSLLPIGSEGTPFNGIFDGNFIPIVGLKVAGNPEDIGMFGYISHISEIRNIICKDLEVSSKGYSKIDESNFLYSEIIEDIFSQNASNFELASLQFVTTYQEEEHIHNLKQVQTFNLNDLESKSTLIDDENSQFNDCRIVNAKFVPIFPTIPNHDIEYSIYSSSDAIQIENGTNNLVINLDNLSDELSSQIPTKMCSNISIVASTKLNGIKYSRVIQSYLVEINHSPIAGSEELFLNLKVDCKYILDDNNNPINFAHGNNIGYLVGHSDGNVEHCYVYNGSLVFNPDNSDLQKVETQTKIGLIGKMGDNVSSDIDPSGATTSGETGVLNFSYIYSLIREPFEAGDETIAGYQGTYKESENNLTGNPETFISYATDKPDDDTGKYLPRGTYPSTFNLYKEYLRTDSDEPYRHFITSAGDNREIKNDYAGAGTAYTISENNSSLNNLNKEMNSVDFAFNKVICDGLTDDEYRGLGVFKIVTGYNSLASNSNLTSLIWRNDIGKCGIVHDFDENAKREIYFSTAECDWTKGGGWDYSTGNISPAIMNTLPTYSNVGSFRYPFSRDFNYMFRLDLSEGEDFVIGNDIYNYMYDTDSSFLKNYLSSILIDRLGQSVEWKNKGFGFKVQFSQDSSNAVSKLDSYMTIGQPSTNNPLNSYTVNGETKYLPQKSVAFSIENPNGANVSVAGCDGYISIYKYNPDNPSEQVQELYTMRSKNDNTDNYGRFFTYSSDGETNTSSLVLPTDGGMRAGKFLFGHIFKLPRGNYFIGSSKRMGSSSAKLYYVCVQGQTNGDLGEMNVVTPDNYVRNVDFLLKDPTNIATPFNINDNSYFAKFSFGGKFADEVGLLIVDTYEINNVTYIRTRFNNFIIELLFYCRKNNPSFVINGDGLISGEALYNGPFVNFTDWGL
ncbi:MAG: hypothetical protein K6E21_04955 [Bacilli bacterium]|nr:hypothetical protein [Bacilli bacterium]